MTKPINEKPEVHYFSGAAKSINFLDRNASASIEAKRVQSFKSFVVTIDLHMHSNASDGILPPAEVVRLCAGNGVKLMSLTDHDTMKGIEEARAEAERRYDKVLSLMHVLEDLRRDDELDPRTLSRTVRTACYDNAFALCIASIFADFTARMPHVRLRAMQADEHLFDYLREDLLDLVFFARQGLHPDVHSVALLTTPYVCLVRRGHPLSERAATLGPLEREDLEAFPQVLINAQPDRYRAPNSPGNGWFNPKNPDRIALVTPFFLAASLCLEETDCYAIVPKATAELALDPRRTAMLQLSDAAPKLTVRLGWHERTHADPGSQLIRAQLLALIQKRFGRPVGE